MLRNYFLIAIRNLWRNRLITLINLVGMSLGIAIFICAWSWARYDLSFDRFHEDSDRMYILNVTIRVNEGEYTSERTGGIFGPLLPEQWPQVLSSCRVSEALEFDLGVPDSESAVEGMLKYLNEDQVLAVDSTFLHFFSFPLLKGNRKQIFTEPDHMVLTESLAKSLFGEEDPLGKSVRLGEGKYYNVAGVLQDPPEASSFQFRALVGFHLMEEMGYTVDGAGGNMFYCTVRLAENTDVDRLNREINEYVGENFDPALEAYFFLDKLTKVHLYGESRGIIGFVINMIMALVILSISVINFINLTTAYSSDRVKEIAIRKSVGAGRWQLILQFLGETYLLLLLSFYLGLFLSEHLMPWMSRTFNVDLDGNLHGASFWLQMVVIFLVTGLLAGLYPAARIAGFNSLDFLSGKKNFQGNVRSRSRKILIVVQFSFSIIFIIASIFLIRQYNHMDRVDLGFNREEVIYIRTTGRVWKEYPQIRRDLESLHFVESVSTASGIPVFLSHGEIEWGDKEGDRNKLAVILETDANFLSTFQIGLAAGSYFKPGEDSLNRKRVVVNKALVDLMGWEDPVGRPFYMWDQDLEILGVTENFQFFPFNMEIFEDRALIYQFRPVREYVFIRTIPGIAQTQIDEIGDIFRMYNPGYEFNYEFVSDYKYETLQNADGIKLLFMLFSGFAILIATMGLIGLSLFYSNRRVKEVGIRKAMGAHAESIMRKFLYDFLKLVALANFISIPVSYLLMRRMLQFFSYRVDLGAGVFLLVILLSLILSIITISFHALRVSRSNPVDSLRYE